MSAPLTDNDRTALDALHLRLAHTASIARLISIHGALGADETDAIRGVAETIAELSERLDGIINPSAREGL